MAFLTADLTGLSTAMRERVHKVCTDENAFAMMQAKLRQARAAKFVRDFQPRSVEGMGGMGMVVDPYWLTYFKATYGTDPVQDPEFRAWLKRQGEDQFFCRSGGTRIQVGGVAMPGRRVFKKTY